jgi:hypothetical protein
VGLMVVEEEEVEVVGRRRVLQSGEGNRTVVAGIASSGQATLNSDCASRPQSELDQHIRNPETEGKRLRTGESMSTRTLSSVGKHSTSPSRSSDSADRTFPCTLVISVAGAGAGA